VFYWVVKAILTPILRTLFRPWVQGLEHVPTDGDPAFPWREAGPFDGSYARPRRLMPVHYEGWSHFREGREAVERELARAPDDIRERVRWLPIGIAQEIDQLS